MLVNKVSRADEIKSLSRLPSNHAHLFCRLSRSVLSLTATNTSDGGLLSDTTWLFSLVLARVFNCNSASLAWHVHKHKDGVSHQCPPAAAGQRHVSGVWSLGAHFKGLCPPGGWREPAGHCCPEERALSWADGSTVTAPHRGGKRFPFSSLFFFFFFATGPAGLGRVGSGVGQ